MTKAIVIGAGPAGLMAAEMLAQAGVSTTVAEAKPSPARKFLMAGKSGLNLTKNEPWAQFIANFPDRAPQLERALRDFGPDEVIEWCKNLGQDVFTGSTKRVFPKTMKASPLLRAWLARLEKMGATLNRNWRWTGWDQNALRFDTAEGGQTRKPDITILACGGASWARLGSDGAWVGQFVGADLAPFHPANMGFEVHWSPHMHRHFGRPVKGIALHVGKEISRGEFIISGTRSRRRRDLCIVQATARRWFADA